MLDFEVHRCSRRCAATDRELIPGETVYSALVAEGGQVVRRDYGADAWPGPPEGAIGWWQGKLPPPGGRKLHWAPSDVMLHYFEQLDGIADKAETRYLLALLMIRRRILRQEAVEQQGGQETLVAWCARNEREYRVPAALPAADRIAAIQAELAQLLQTEPAAAPPEPAAPSGGREPAEPTAANAAADDAGPPED